MGWFRESYRHSLAARFVIRGRGSKELLNNPNYVNLLGAVVPRKEKENNPIVYRDENDIEVLKSSAAWRKYKKEKNVEKKSMVKKINEEDEKRVEELLKVAKKIHNEESSKYVPISELMKDEEVKPVISKGTVVEQSVVYTDEDLDEMYNQANNRESMAIREYLHDNLGSNGDTDKITAFWNGASHTLFRPMDDLDCDWKSYNHTIGRDVVVHNTMDKWTNRGAALVGRVVTLANIEPLLDHENGRSFRDSMVDLEFGRRLD